MAKLSKNMNEWETKYKKLQKLQKLQKMPKKNAFLFSSGGRSLRAPGGCDVRDAQGGRAPLHLERKRPDDEAVGHEEDARPEGRQDAQGRQHPTKVTE